MPPAAPDSSAEELSGIFMKKRHASQDVELRPLHYSLAHTHTHFGVKAACTAAQNCSVHVQMCVLCNLRVGMHLKMQM